MGNNVVKTNSVAPAQEVEPSNTRESISRLQKSLADNEYLSRLIDFIKSEDMTAYINMITDLNDAVTMDRRDSEVIAGDFQRIFLAETAASRMMHGSQRGFAAALEKCDPVSQVVFLLVAQRQYEEHVKKEKEEKVKKAKEHKKEDKKDATEKAQDGKDDVKAEGSVQPAEGTDKKTPTSVLTRLSPEEEEEQSRSFLAEALNGIDEDEKDRLFCAQSWLAKLLVAVETLPVCVSIATADPKRRGFPLIYVNAYFEATSGYSREEIIGQNCRFLQAGKAEEESIQRLSLALRDAKPVKVSITNYRKDGMPFRNLLAMKPIFDENGVYCYVVGIQFDVTAADATPKRLKMADDLMKMLPDVIPIQSNDEL